jgi:hypothetical protein
MRHLTDRAPELVRAVRACSPADCLPTSRAPATPGERREGMPCRAEGVVRNASLVAGLTRELVSARFRVIRAGVGPARKDEVVVSGPTAWGPRADDRDSRATGDWFISVARAKLVTSCEGRKGRAGRTNGTRVQYTPQQSGPDAGPSRGARGGGPSRC